MATMTYLHRDPRTGIYHHRRAVPSELRGIIGKREVKRSLGTKESKEAKRRNQEVGLEVDRLLQSARDTLDGHPVFDAIQADALTSRWLHKALHEDTEERVLGAGGDKDADHLSDFLGNVRGALAAPVNLKFARTKVRDVLEEEGLVIPEGTEVHRVLSLAMLRVLAEFAKVTLERSHGRWTDAGSPPPERPVVVGAARPVRSAPKADSEAGGPMLSALLDAWMTERKPSPKITREWRTAFRRLTEVIGEDMPARSVTKAHVRDYKNALLRCPARTAHKLRRRTLPDIVRLTKAQDVARLSPASINKSLGAISSVFEWSVGNGYLDSNVTTGLKVRDPEKAKDKRLSFSKEDLATIFGPNHQKHRKADPDMFWLPLLALYTGARLEELGQALVADIKEEQGITFLDINDEGPGKRLKNQSSRRSVPVHPALVQAGFLEYVAERREAGDDRLFPGMRRDRDGSWTAAFSKTFGRRLRVHLGITERRKVFHSFRHTFKDACSAVLIPREVNDALTGHAGGTVGSTYGSEGIPLKIKAAELEKIAYPGVKA